MSTDPVRLMTNRALPYLIGCGFFSTGAYLFIVSNLGTDPLDTFALGLLRHVPLTIGLAQASVALVCLVVVALWTRQRPLASPLLTFFFCGSLIDLLRLDDAARLVPLAPPLLLAIGTTCCAYGSSLIIMSNFGIRAMDLLAIAMVRRWHWPFWVAKGVLEMTLLGTGWLMGGPAGVGTVCFLIGVDLLIQPMIGLNASVLKVRNLGLPPAFGPSASDNA